MIPTIVLALSNCISIEVTRQLLAQFPYCEDKETEAQIGEVANCILHS